MRRALLPLVFAILLLAPPARGADEVTVREGETFRLTCHFAGGKIDDAVADAAIETVEAIWGVAGEIWELPKGPPAGRFDVHLYATPADYEVAEAGLTGGSLARNLAMVHHATRSAHVAMQPPLPEDVPPGLAMPALTRHLLLHEVAHLARYAATGTFTGQPAWLVDGAAMWIGERTMEVRGWSRGLTESAYTSTDLVRCRRLLEEDALPTADAVLSDALDALAFYDRYAVRDMFFRFLVEGRRGRTVIVAIRKALRSPPASDPARVRRGVEAALGSSRATLDREFRAWLRSKKPSWEEGFRTLDTAQDPWVQSAFQDVNALAWRTEPAGPGRFSIQGSVDLVAGRDGHIQANLLLGRAADGFVSVAFTAGYGLNVYRYYASEDRWEERGRAPVGALLPAKAVPFRVEVEGDRVSVAVDGRVVLSTEVSGRPLSGPWGVGAYAGSVVRWHGVRVVR